MNIFDEQAEKDAVFWGGTTAEQARREGRDPAGFGAAAQVLRAATQDKLKMAIRYPAEWAKALSADARRTLADREPGEA